MKNKKKIIILGSVLLITGTVVGVLAFGTPKSVQTAFKPKKTQQLQGNVIEASGKIKANDVKNIMLDFPASIKSMNLQEGQPVKLGEELATLDFGDFRQQIASKEGALNQALLQLEISNNDLNTYTNQLAQDIAQYNKDRDNNTSVQLKEKDYEYAKEVFNREKNDLAKKQSLYGASAISKSELDAQQRRYDDAEKSLNDKKMLFDDASYNKQQTLDKLQNSITQEESKINDLKLNIEIQKQNIATLQSDINQMKNKLNKSFMKGNSIVADVKNGMIQKVSHMSGDYIQANTTLFNLVNMDTLIVEADVLEDFIKDVKVGAEVEIIPLSDSSKVYKGHVLKTSGMGAEKNGETVVTTQISIDNPDEYLKPDFNVDVRISK